MCFEFVRSAFCVCHLSEGIVTLEILSGVSKATKRIIEWLDFVKP